MTSEDEEQFDSQHYQSNIDNPTNSMVASMDKRKIVRKKTVKRVANKADEVYGIVKK